MCRYVCLYDVKWRNKKGELVVLPIFFEILVLVNNDVVDVYVRPLGLRKRYEYTGEVGEREVDDLIMNIVAQDISRELRRKFKRSLKGVVFETMSISLIYLNKKDIQEKKEKVE